MVQEQDDPAAGWVIQEKGMCLICIWVNVSYYLFSFVSISLYGGTFNKPANIMNFIFH